MTKIHALLASKHPRISLATVYRTMRTLRDAGIVEEHSFGEGRSHYELASGSHHDHLIDTTSGAIVEFCDPEIERLQQAIAKRLGYRLVGHKLEPYAVPRDDPAGPPRCATPAGIAPSSPISAHRPLLQQVPQGAN